MGRGLWVMVVGCGLWGVCGLGGKTGILATGLRLSKSEPYQTATNQTVDDQYSEASIAKQSWQSIEDCKVFKAMP